MKIRRRPKGGHSRGAPRVLSTPEPEPIAEELAPPPPLPRKRRRARVPSGDLKRPPVGVHPSTGDVINAFWQKKDLVLVLPDARADNGIRFQRLPAQHCCFIKRSDMEDPEALERLLTHHHAVRKLEWEGDSDEWLRVVWQTRDQLKHYCKLLQSDAKEDGSPKTPVPTYEGMVSPVLRHMADNNLRPHATRTVWVDLETDSDVPISLMIEGEARILSWATEDTDGNRRSGMLREFTDEAERELLEELWDVFEHYDQILAWGGDRFDFPIIKFRSQRYGLLRGGIREWRRWLWLDHLELYRRMAMASAESGDEKTSMALQAVSMAILGEGKDDFDASRTRQAWNNDVPCKSGKCMACRSCLLKYNIKDTALMPRIEAKTGFVEILQNVCDTCGIFADSHGSKPGPQADGFLARLALQEGHKFPTVLNSRSGQKFEGAYVLHPEENAGVHKDVHVADFAGLYPNAIKTWNISPETLLSEVPSEPGDWSYSPYTNKAFSTAKPGLLPLAVTQLMALREKWNKAKAAAPPETDEWNDANRRSAAYKITANSFYGIMGDPYSRHYSRDSAESVAQCAKLLLVETLKQADKQGMTAIYGDTDSLFVANATRERFEEFVRWCNVEYYPDRLRALGCKTNSIDLVYEKMFARLIFTTAKRYAGNYVHYKGTDATAESKPEIKGLEFKRGDSLRITRRMQEEVIYQLVGYKTDDDPDDISRYHEIVGQWFNRVLGDRFDVDDIVVNVKLGKALEEYKVANPMVRIAREMQARGEDVAEGVRIQYVILDASVSPQLVQSVPDWDPDADSIDRVALWDKQIWPATEKLLQAAFPGEEWTRFADLVKVRRATARAKLRAEKAAVKATEKEAKALVRATAKAERDREKDAKRAAKEAEKQLKVARGLPVKRRPRKVA